MATVDPITGIASNGGPNGGASVLKPELTSWWEKTFVILYLGIVALGLMYLLVRLWPESQERVWIKQVTVFWRSEPITMPDEVRLLLMVIVAGGLGSFIHAATSFVDYVGNQMFFRSWLLWYLMRPMIGSALALVLYVAVRGGLLNATATTENVSPFGVTALAFLAGMFSKQATDKLNELFTTMFKTSGESEAARKDKLDAEPPDPRIISIEPSQLQPDGSLDLGVNGSAFESASIVRLNGEPKPTTFIDSTKVVAKLTSSDAAKPGPWRVTVDNASGKSSPPVTVTRL